ncbi:MAG: ATP-dependent dethiobiotin synthetase BioD, partial [Persephonella sp.]
YNVVIVEGAGGLLVPIKKINGKIFTYLDLIKALDVPVIIVAKSTLGTINHTVLTVRALKNEGVYIKGIIMNKYPQNPDWVVKTNPEVIKEMTGIDKIIKIPYLEDISEDIKRKVMLLV